MDIVLRDKISKVLVKNFIFHDIELFPNPISNEIIVLIENQLAAKEEELSKLRQKNDRLQSSLSPVKDLNIKLSSELSIERKALELACECIRLHDYMSKEERLGEPDYFRKKVQEVK